MNNNILIYRHLDPIIMSPRICAQPDESRSRKYPSSSFPSGYRTNASAYAVNLDSVLFVNLRFPSLPLHSEILRFIASYRQKTTLRIVNYSMRKTFFAKIQIFHHPGSIILGKINPSFLKDNWEIRIALTDWQLKGYFFYFKHTHTHHSINLLSVNVQPSPHPN